MSFRPRATLVSAALVALSALTAAPSATANSLSATGAGGRIFGLDISRYQHGTSQPIDFAKMSTTGVSFIWINGGNTLSAPDALAAKYYQSDRKAAQEQGIYTGLYYYVHLPNTKKSALIKRNADSQANKVLARINADGGLNNLDMPVALDIETSCTRTTLFGICRHSMSPAQTSLWVNEWQKVIAAGTHRTPVIYSFLSLLHGSLGADKALVLNPLWISTAGVSASKPNSQPGQKKGGCSTNVWTSELCTLQWTFWQYTSGASGRTYGIPSGQVDLDLFAGRAQDFLNFASTGQSAPLVTPVITPVETSTTTSDQ